MSLEFEVFLRIRSVLNFDFEPATGELKLVSSKEEKGKAYTTFESEKYTVDLMKQSDAKEAYLSFSVERKDACKFKVKGYGVECLIPIVDFEHVFSPHNLAEGGGFRGTHQSFEWYTGANMYIPLVLCVNRYGVNRFSVGFMDQVLETEINGHTHSRETQKYQIKLKRPVRGIVLTRTRVEDALAFYVREESWFDTVEKYCGKVDEFTHYKPAPIPEAYYEPQWNSWIPFYLAINQEDIWEYAKLCKELGIKMVSIDAGWESAGSETWDEFGDWIPKPQKFPDMSGLISRIQEELGMLVELFVAPFWVGPASEAFKRLKKIRIVTEDGESASLCPRNPLTEKHVCEVASRIARELRPDFLLIDLTVSLPIKNCVTNHKHIYESMGEGYNKCIKAICKSVHEANPGTMIEACDTTNLNSKHFWPVTYDSVGGEVGFDVSLHQRQMVFMRSFSRGIVPKHTPLPWHMEAPNEEFGKRMIQQVILGVPSIVADLKRLFESHARILRAWMNFYRQNRKELISGEFRPIGFFGSTFPHVKVEGLENLFIQIGSAGVPSIVLKRRYRKAFILNSTESENLYLVLDGLEKGEYKAEFRNCFLNLVGEKKILCDSKCPIDLNIPQGGLAYIEKT